VRASATLFPPGKPAALLAYLAAAPGRTASRDHLIDLLWSDRELEPARHALRQTLWYIRRRAGDDVVVADGVSVTLHPGVACDRDDFLAAIDAGDFGRAVHLYSGEFLPGFAAPGGAQFEQWADAERRRLRSAFIRCAELSVRRHLGASRTREAIALARRARDADPASEPGWRLLLEALVAGEDFVNAAAEAGQLERLLADDGRDPEPATRAALRVARQASPAHGTAPVQPAIAPELIGRETEFAALLAAWDDAGAGRARHLHVEARAGIGKTRLLASVHARLRAARQRVVLVRAHQGGHAIPYSFASDLVSELARLPGARGISPAAAGALVALNPSLSTWYDAAADTARDDEALRRRAVALHELVGALAEDAPLALLLDDLHWVDLPSRAMLLRLLEHLGGERLLVVTAGRTMAGHRPVVDHTHVLPLHPLDLQEVAAFVASIAALPASPWADQLPARLLEATHGAPLLLVETRRLLQEREWVRIAGGTWAAGDTGALAAALHAGSALRARVDALPGTARDALRLLAAAAAPVTGVLLATACDCAELDQSLAELEQRGLAVRVNAGWEVAHDEIATTVLEASTPEQLREAHRRLARALLREGSRGTALAMRAADHLLEAGDDAALASLFAEWLAKLPAPQRRDPAARARELLGEQGDEARVRALVRSLPWHRRVDRRPTALVAAGLAVAALLAVVMRPQAVARPIVDATLIVAITDSTGTTRFSEAQLTESLLRDSAEVPVRPMPAQPRWLDLDAFHFTPDGARAAYARMVGDSSGSDLYVTDTVGPGRLVLPGRADDLPQGWSPDGTRLLVISGRWSAKFYHQLGILDPATGRLTRLVASDEADRSATWSPDGSRIAFARRAMSRIAPDQLCLVGADGSAERCRGIPPYLGVVPVSWLDERRLLVEGNRGDGSVLLVVDVGDAADWIARVLDPRRGTRIASPDGRWLACICTSDAAGPQFIVHPAEHPERWARVSGPPPLTGRVTLRTPPRPPRWLSSLAITAPARVPVDGSALLRAIARDSAGHPLDLPADAIQWRSLDTAIAIVDSTGTLRPRRVGTVRVEASAGGWRRAVTRMEVAEPQWALLLREDWREGVAARFVPFGAPRPSVVTSPDGLRAMVNNGDGNYSSGAYSRLLLDATQGLGARATVSLPVTRAVWQTLSLSFTAALEEGRLRHWNHGDGPLPMRGYGGECAVGYPNGEGTTALAAFAALVPEERAILAPPDVRDGHWITLEVQLFPDGRCGVAIDGVPRAIGRTTIPLDRPFRVLLGGNSAGTRMAIGPLEVWSGVRPDVPWKSLAP
jgi:DNA-binding SARP family transcriptional activator